MIRKREKYLMEKNCMKRLECEILWINNKAYFYLIGEYFLNTTAKVRSVKMAILFILKIDKKYDIIINF